ncbi:MAG: acylphosphatase [Candidatus Entotheonellia bacterium]
MGQVRAAIVVSGLVQGVYFRADACDVARQLGLSGWVRNRRDGCVQAVVEGEDAAVQGFIAWCHRGPPSARVVDVHVTWEPYQGEFDTFTIRG